MKGEQLQTQTLTKFNFNIFFGEQMTDKEFPKPNHHGSARRTRKRTSSLDNFYYPIAQHLLNNARAKKNGVKKLSLDGICKELERTHGVQVNKSTLSRFISRHNTLKLL